MKREGEGELESQEQETNEEYKIKDTQFCLLPPFFLLTPDLLPGDGAPVFGTGASPRATSQRIWQCSGSI